MLHRRACPAHAQPWAAYYPSQPVHVHSLLRTVRSKSGVEEMLDQIGPLPPSTVRELSRLLSDRRSEGFLDSSELREVLRKLIDLRGVVLLDGAQSRNVRVAREQIDCGPLAAKPAAAADAVNVVCSAARAGR